MIKTAIIGYGNIGKYAVEAVKAACDMELAGVVRRSTSEIPPELSDIKVTDNIKDLGKVDVALICAPSRSVPDTAKKYLQMGINTVDSYDIHTSIYELKQELAQVAKQNNAVSIISAGWDPGSDSIVRALMEALTPKGITHTNFGEGMSMGHSVAVKSKTGVSNALSVTIPTGTGVHRRMVYVEPVKGTSDSEFDAIVGSIKEDPYFVHDETHVVRVTDVNSLIDTGHGVNMVRKGVSGQTHNQMLEFNMKINNPALTSQVMVSCARASMKQAPGSYTMIELPVINLVAGDEEEIIRRLV